MKNSTNGRQTKVSEGTTNAKFQGGNQKGAKVCGKIGIVTPMASSSYGTPKDKGVNR